jgi:hypothetical protein
MSDTEADAVDGFIDLMQEELGYTNTNTHPSCPVTIIDLPEAWQVSSEFFYNYYTRDERTATTGDHTVVDIASDSSEVEFIKGKDDFPRANILKINVDNIVTTISDTSFLRNYANSIGSDFIKRNKEKIVFEGAIANTRFSSIILADNQVDETFYKELTDSVAFTELSSETYSHGEISNDLARMFSAPMSAATATPSNVRKALSNTQPLGIAYAPSDARIEVIAEALRDVRFVEFNFTVNNAVASNMVLGSLEDRGNIYQDELLSIRSNAEDVQSNYVATANPGTLDSSEFELELAALEVFLLSDITGGGFDADESSIPIGFYIEKTEIQTSGGKFTSKVMDPIIIDRYGNYNIFDYDVRYGATYVYNVKVIYIVSYEATAVDPEGLTDEEIVFAISMVANQGVRTSIAALENIPPGPPRNLRFNYDFQTDSLDIYWEEPSNPQRDVVRYQLFRRSTTSDPFTLIAELDFDKSTQRVVPLEIAPKEKAYSVGGARKYFKDVTFDRDKSYIYSLASIDARGLTSCYSEQIGVSFDRYKNKISRSRVSQPGAPKPYPNLYLKKDLFVDNMSTSGAERMRIFFDPEYFDVVETKTEAASGGTITTSLGLISDKYKLQIINLDLQDSTVFSIDISDETGPPMNVPMTSANIRSIF